MLRQLRRSPRPSCQGDGHVGRPIVQVYTVTDIPAQSPCWRTPIIGPRSRDFIPSGSVAGRAVPGAELRIVGTDSSPHFDPGQLGEVWIRSPQNMVGYWRKSGETAATVDPEGWLRTGDAGYLDADGYLFIHDRVKDMVITGGRTSIRPRWKTSPWPIPRWRTSRGDRDTERAMGETVLAVVVARPESAPDADGIIGFARSRLAHYKCPTGVEFVESLPRNASGKVLKRELRAPYWSDRRRSVG